MGKHPMTETVIPDGAERAQRMRAQGLWADKTIDDGLHEAVRDTPSKSALVAYRADRPEAVRFSYAELKQRVDAAARSLHRLGIGHQDIVAIQLPNWWEFVVTALACGQVGAVVNPLMPIFREHELGYMLRFSAAKLLVVPQVFRSFDHAAMARHLKSQIPTLQHIAVVDGEGEDGFEQVLQQEQAPRAVFRGLEPDDLAVLMFTSGTTGEPKGVMHCCNTLIACTRSLAERFHLGVDDVHLCCSPMGHMTGYTAGALQSLMLGGTLVLQDVWDPKRAAEIMAREGVTHSAGSTPFLNDLCEAVLAGADQPAKLKTFLCGGAPIPPVLIERAIRELGVDACSLWGMTETLAGTLTEPERVREKSSTTDGRAVRGMEVRVVDNDGKPLPLGETGRLMVRGAQMFMGYYKRPEIVTFDAEGWFDTGDLAYVDAEGYIRINGRTKDVLIRGGENIPVFEIESLLYKHPAVAAAAIVGYPDERLGERACAFVTVRPGASFDLAACQAWMSQNQVAKQYWPERVECLASMPTTASGKIQKFALREKAKAFGEPQGAAS
jgi:cyclohexanecarboxylate-CoA ligase